MSESAARADRFGLSPASSSSSPAYSWEVPGKPVAVRMGLDLVDRLEKEVVESFRSLSSRGSEIGGLLLGAIQSGSPARVSIEAYELVPCDYARGPLYQFSEADAERFERAAEQRNAGGGLRVVGFFRSHTRKGLGLDAEDIAFFSGHFRDPQQVALLIRPYASKPSTAGFFMWENGAVRGEASALEFPFRRSELERMPLPEIKNAPEKAAPASDAGSALADSSSAKPPARAQIVPIASRREISLPAPPPPERPAAKSDLPAEPPAPPRFAEKSAPAEPASKQEELAPPPFAKSATFAKSAGEPATGASPLADLVLPPLERPRRGKMIWVTAGSAAVLLLLSGALIYPGFGHKTKHAPLPGQAAAALSLRVERSSGELLLTWNRDSEAIRNAVRAVLTIADGDQHENVNLDLAQLKNGSVVYSPTGSDVSFQLSIFGQNSVQTNSESVRVLRTRPSPMAETPQAPQQKSAAAVQTRPDSNPAAPAQPAPASQPTVTVADSTPSKPAAAPLKEFHAESLAQRLRPARPTDLPEAPGLTTTAAPSALSLPGLNGSPIASIAPPPSISSQGAAPKAGGQVQAAQLVSSVPPEYPLVAKNAHQQGIVVVSAMIGVDGKVKSATAVSGPGLLQKAAVDAVKQWVYKPTTLNGAPVESETRVEVKFQAGR